MSESEGCKSEGCEWHAGINQYQVLYDILYPVGTERMWRELPANPPRTRTLSVMLKVLTHFGFIPTRMTYSSLKRLSLDTAEVIRNTRLELEQHLIGELATEVLSYAFGVICRKRRYPTQPLSCETLEWNPDPDE